MRLVRSAYLCSMSIIELEEFFTKHTPDKEVKINQSATIRDTSVFLETCFLRVKEWKGDINNCPSYWLLLELYNVERNTKVKGEAS